MRRLVLFGLVVALGTPLVSAEQDVRPIIPPGTGEQQIEVISPRGDQSVQAARMAGEQQVEPQTEASRAAKAASTAGKVLTGVAAAAAALGATAAMMIFL